MQNYSKQANNCHLQILPVSQVIPLSSIMSNNFQFFFVLCESFAYNWKKSYRFINKLFYFPLGPRYLDVSNGLQCHIYDNFINFTLSLLYIKILNREQVMTEESPMHTIFSKQYNTVNTINQEVRHITT